MVEGGNQCIQIPQEFARIDRARGIVGGIEDDRLGARGDGGGDASDVGLERVIRFDRHHAPGVVLNIKLILGKERNQEDDLVAGIEQRLEHYIDGARGSDGHEDVIGRVSKARLPRQFPGNDFPHRGEARIGHVGVAAGRIPIDRPSQRPDHLFRGFAVRVSQREIKDILFPALPFHSGANLEHSPDPGGVFHLFRNVFADAHRISLLATTLMPADCSRAMAASGLSKRKIMTAVSPRPKVNAYMYSMLMPVGSKTPNNSARPPGRSGTSTATTSVTLTT